MALFNNTERDWHAEVVAMGLTDAQTERIVKLVRDVASDAEDAAWDLDSVRRSAVHAAALAAQGTGMPTDLIIRDAARFANWIRSGA